MKTLQDILAARNLAGAIQMITNGLPQPVPSSFLTPSRTISGDTCTYWRVEGTRQLARLVQYGSPSRKRDLTGLSEQSVKLMHSFEHEILPAATLTSLLSMDGAVQRLGEAEVARQVRAFSQLFANLRLSAVMSVLNLGALYFDGNGNLLPSSSGAKVTIDFSVPAGNKTSLDVLGTGAIIAASWATAGTAIHTHVRNLKSAALKLTGYPITTAFYGSNILNYFLANTYLKELLNRNAGYQTIVAGGEIPQGFLGLNWYPICDSFFVDQDGTTQSWTDADNVIFTPTPSADWWETIEGTYPVPQDLIIGGDATAVLKALSPTAGRFGYAELMTDPPGIKMLAGDTFLPVLKVPKAIFIGHTTP